MRFCLAAFCAVVGAGSSFGEILVSEGCDTADYKNVGSGASLLGSYPKAYTVNVGVKGKWSGYGAQPRVWPLGLPLPACFAEAGIAARGSASVGLNMTSGSSATDHRWAYLSLTDNLLKSQSGKLYFRVLMNVNKDAASKLVAGNAMANNTCYGCGLSSIPSSYSTGGGTPLGVKNSLGFYVWKRTDGFKLALWTTAADGTTHSYYRLIDPMTAPSTKGAEAKDTYVCYAEIDIGAGANGKEKIRAGAVSVTDYDPDNLAWSDPIETELISETASPTHLFFVGPYIAPDYALFDEFAVSTDVSEILAVTKAGQTFFENAALVAADDVFTLTGVVTRAAATNCGAIAESPSGVRFVFPAGAREKDAAVSVEIDRTKLAAGETYLIHSFAENEVGAKTNEVGALYNGSLTLTKVCDADEGQRTPGEVTVSRAAADPWPITVNYSLTSEAPGAAEGKTWAAPGPTVIPAGATSATLRLDPLPDGSVRDDIIVTMTLANGLYVTGPAPAHVDLKIVDFNVEKGFAKKIVFKPSGYAGSETLTDFPLLVRLSSAVSDFSYDDFALVDGGDLRFATAAGEPLVHEIDTWDPDGESLVWVKVPALRKNTEIVAYYGNVKPWPMTSDGVWDAQYLGVWHFNEIAEKKTPDATGNGLAMEAKNANQTAVSGGRVGKALVNATAAGGTDGGFLSPVYTGKFTSNAFTVSAWFNRLGHAMNGYERYFSTKNAYADANGFELEDKNGSATECTVRGSAGDAVVVKMPDQSKAGWNKLTLVYNGSKLTAYTNGVVSVKDQTVTSVVHKNGFGVGNNAARNERALYGNVDEVRFAKSCESADWVKAEYDTESKSDFVTSEQGVEPVDATAVRFEGKPFLAKVADAFRVGVTTTDDSGTGVLTAVCDTAEEEEKAVAVTSSAAASTDYVATLEGLTADKSYRAGFLGVNDKKTETRAYATNVLFNGVLAIAKGEDADEKDLAKPGTITVSRADVFGDLIVNYTVGGTGVAGTHYQTLPGTIVIPDGAASATIEIWPLRAKSGDHTVEVTLADGLYFLDEGAKTAAITVKVLAAPDGWNTWIANESGKASVAANWSDGVPKAGDKVLFDGRYSTANCEWDADASATVAAWRQTADYTGTVQIDTEYDGSFAALNVTGDVEILGGNWTHQANLAADGQKYRLKAVVGGSFNLGSGRTITGEKKGYWGGKCPSGKAKGAHAASGDGYQYVYGNVYRPADLGAGSNDAGSATDIKAGGGAIWLEVGGALTLDGTINVRGRQFDGSNTGCGSVYIKAASCGGAGTILANYSASGYYNGNRGSGGRVAIELTAATALELPVANVKIDGVCSGASGGGGGTFYVKTADPAKPNGTLYLDDTRGKSYGARWLHWKAITAIPAGETWTFDEIVISNYGRLLVPAGTTLNLPNGPQSVRASSTRLGGIVVNGGTVNWGTRSTYEFSGKWVFQSMQNYTFDGDVIVRKDGAIGAMCFFGKADLTDFAGCDITVNGNLTIENGGYVQGTGCGPDISINRNVISSHGGQSAGATGNIAYDSIFTPSLPGYGLARGDQAESNPGGALIALNVRGTLTNDGAIAVSGARQSGTGSSGGSLRITAARLAGAGTFAADSASDSSGTAGGGRIAIRLTEQAVDAALVAKVSARGATVVSAGASTDKSSSAGTVYLQGRNDGELGGTIFVRNDNNALNVNTYTPIPAGATKAGVTPDAAEAFKRASLVVGDCARVKLFETLKMSQLTMAAGTSLDLNGQTLTVYSARLGDQKLRPGTYMATSAALAGLVTDSAGSGQLVVKGRGVTIIIR